MASIKVKIRVGDAEIETEGAKADVDEILNKWWALISMAETESPEIQATAANNQKPPRRSPSGRRVKKASVTSSPASAEAKFDANDLANQIKQHPKFRMFREKVLHGTNRYHKVALICNLSDVPLTSGDINRTLEALGVKVGVGNVSNVIGTNSGDFMNSIPRKAGGAVPRYKLTSHAQNSFEAMLNEQA